MNALFRLIPTLLFAVLLLPDPALAHRMLLTVHAQSDPIRVEVYYDSTAPAQQAHMSVRSETGTIIAQGLSDDHGVWTFPRPAPGTWIVMGESLGHLARQKLTIPGSPSVDPSPAAAPDFATTEIPPPTEHTVPPVLLPVLTGFGIITGLCLLLWLRNHLHPRG
jgi:hypothetical protein